MCREGTDVSGGSLILLTDAICGGRPSFCSRELRNCVYTAGFRNRMLRWERSKFGIVPGDEPGF
jgi:hypothetical protein